MVGDKRRAKIAVEPLCMGRLRIIWGRSHMPYAVPETHTMEDSGLELGTIVGNQGGGHSKMLEQLGLKCPDRELSRGTSQGEQPAELREGVHTNKQHGIAGLATWERSYVVYENLLKSSLRHLRRQLP